MNLVLHFGWAIFLGIEDLIVLEILLIGLSLALGLWRSERLGNFARKFVAITVIKFLGLDYLTLKVIWVSWIKEVILFLEGNLALLEAEHHGRSLISYEA